MLVNRTNSIVFIEEPKFVVDFTQYKKTKSVVGSSSLAKRVSAAVVEALQFIAFVFEALAQSLYTTLRYSWTYLVRELLEETYYYNAAYRLSKRIVNWLLGLTWGFIVTWTRLVYEKAQINKIANQNIIDQYAGSELDRSHIYAVSTKIDMSQVPESVKIDELLTIFDEIDFYNQVSLHHMARTALQEGATLHAPDQLRRALQDAFISNVKSQRAILGTPPAWDISRLTVFYKQIENAVRFSIHQANMAIDEFKAKNGSNKEEYQGDVAKEYKNLFENRARIAINLAIAGKHCGARYMGEAMELYDSFSASEEKEKGSLKEDLITILAAKRRELALQQIHEKMGYDTHDYNVFMSHLGQVLGIPGTENVIEHLSKFNSRKHLKTFFAKYYTVNCIIQTIQDKVKSSQPFRVKITDWVKDQIGEWNKHPFDLKPLEQRLQPVLNAKTLATSDIKSRLDDLCELVALLQDKGVQEIVEDSLDGSCIKVEASDQNFASELFGLKQTKEWLESKLSTDIVVERVRVSQKFRELFSGSQLGESLIRKVRSCLKEKKPLNSDEFGPRLLSLQKAIEVRSVVSELGVQIREEQAMRITEVPSSLGDIIESKQTEERNGEFITRLGLGEMHEKGLSPELMEWILVSQGVLCSQADLDEENTRGVAGV